MNSVLKSENEFQVDVRRTAVTYNLEKLANKMLSDINIACLSNVQYKSTKICQQSIPWKDDQFWNDLSNPNEHQQHKSVDNPSKTQAQVQFQLIPLPKIQLKNGNSISTAQNTILENSRIIMKYLEKWKNYTKFMKDKKIKLNTQLEQREKLNNFMKMLKKFKNREISTTKTSLMEIKHADDKVKVITQNESPTRSKLSVQNSCYKHRFVAQQQIISIQKKKLMYQEKIIQNLKLGKLSEDINQSIKETEKQIQETFTKCSVKVKCKVGTIIQLPESTQNESINFQINSDKVPKIVQQMEQRAIEREHKRQLILERKRLLDRKKKQAIELEIENKKTLDEEERKINLREIKERRQKQMEIQQQILTRKKEFFENCSKADGFYRKRLIRKVFRSFLKLIMIKQSYEVKSQQFYRMSMKRKYLKIWIKFIEDLDYLKIKKAEELYVFKLKNRVLRLWFSEYTLSVQHLQVAEDLYEMRLQSKMFIHWHRYTCTQYVLQIKNEHRSNEHYKNKILLHYFYQWKLLPAVIQLEKAKEAKKLRWREKVREVLSDYTPAIED